MKKTFIVLALAMSAQFASAEMTLLPSNHPIYGDSAKGMDTVIIGYISNADWDRAMAESLSRQSNKLPILAPEQTVTDEGGIEYKCSNAGLSRHNCVSLVKTKKYHEDMVAIAKAIIASGQEKAFPRFAGWFKIVK